MNQTIKSEGKPGQNQVRVDLPSGGFVYVEEQEGMVLIGIYPDPEGIGGRRIGVHSFIDKNTTQSDDIFIRRKSGERHRISVSQPESSSRKATRSRCIRTARGVSEP